VRTWLLAAAATLPFTFTTPASAQETAAPAPGTTGAVRVFLDCNYSCDETYTRREITFVDYVRDRREADVHILITTQDTGGGGTEYTVKFIGLSRFANVEQTLRHVTEVAATSDERRKAITEVLKRGLVRYVAESPLASRIRITLAEDTGKKTGQQDPSKDPWNLWVFSIEFGGGLDGERSSKSHSVRSYLSANRTTDALKVQISANGNYRENTFELGEGETFTSTSRSFTNNALVARSLTRKFSAAVVTRASSSTFINQDFAFRGAGGVEYDLFPYSESTRRLLTFQYTVGFDYFDYKEETIYGKASETLADHRLQTSLSMRQPWGSSFASVSFSQFLNKPSKYSITAYGDANVRLFKGFSFNVYGEVARTRDQLYLRRGEATTEEILVRQRQLETGYRYYMQVGISYSFGSIFNNVVNPRFGS
jgi:hypothetical protein